MKVIQNASRKSRTSHMTQHSIFIEISTQRSFSFSSLNNMHPIRISIPSIKPQRIAGRPPTVFRPSRPISTTLPKRQPQLTLDKHEGKSPSKLKTTPDSPTEDVTDFKTQKVGSLKTC